MQRVSSFHARNLIGERLDQGVQASSLNELSQHWFIQAIEVRVPLAGIAHDHPALITMVRGAWGRQLMSSASQNTRAGKPCNWNPPCGLGAFFVDHLDSNNNGLPRPYSLGARRDGADLILSLRVFGFANEWILDARSALINALRTSIRWNDLGVPPNSKQNITDCSVSSVELRHPDQKPKKAVIEFISPVDDESGRLRDEPLRLVDRLKIRTRALARWHDLVVPESTMESWVATPSRESVKASLRTIDIPSWNSGRPITKTGLAGTVSFALPGHPLVTLLSIGETTGIGRGTVKGLGRYSVYFE